MYDARRLPDATSAHASPAPPTDSKIGLASTSAPPARAQNEHVAWNSPSLSHATEAVALPLRVSCAMSTRCAEPFTAVLFAHAAKCGGKTISLSSAAPLILRLAVVASQRARIQNVRLSCPYASTWVFHAGHIHYATGSRWCTVIGIELPSQHTFLLYIYNIYIDSDRLMITASTTRRAPSPP